MTSPSEAWSPTDSTPIIPVDRNNENHNWSQSNTNAPSTNKWEDSEFEPLEENPGGTTIYFSLLEIFFKLIFML